MMTGRVWEWERKGEYGASRTNLTFRVSLLFEGLMKSTGTMTSMRGKHEHEIVDTVDTEPSWYCSLQETVFSLIAGLASDDILKLSWCTLAIATAVTAMLWGQSGVYIWSRWFHDHGTPAS